ncbi:MAG: iron-sulfur cluster-binding protein [Acidobacteria bacterium]|nr:iron-sulfur cluster-binding protein [Acidobacteriota bacterium]
MPRATVAVLRTQPSTVVDDYHALMNLAGYRQVVAPAVDTALKVNISWHFFFPGSSTTPWQLDGVIRAMKQDGYDPARIHACHNRTVVIDAHLGERENKHLPVVEAHGLRNVHLYEGEEWVHIRDAVGDLADRFLCLNDVYPQGFLIPKRFIGENIIHLPTVKTHVFTTTTGAMKNAFGGLLNERRHWTHPVIHETLVDLLMIQQKIHRGVFAVMDGTFAGDGPGPRCMTPHVKNVILASSDQVAIDAVAAKLMGFDPLSIKYIRLAHDAGLGCGDPREIAIAGDEAAASESWNFVGPFRKMTFASRMQHKIYWGPLRRPLEWSLKTVLAPWAYLASVLYHDSFWYPLKGRAVMREVLTSDWGRLFRGWEHAASDGRGYQVEGLPAGTLRRTGLRALLTSFGILGTCLREAPEFANRRRRLAEAPARRRAGRS